MFRISLQLQQQKQQGLVACLQTISFGRDLSVDFAAFAANLKHFLFLKNTSKDKKTFKDLACFVWILKTK